MEEKEKILLAARDLFLAEGFYRTPVDELATKLGMSKKTIYKYFPTKDELVKEVVFSIIKMHMANISKIIILDIDAVSKFFQLMSYLGAMISKQGDRWMKDIQTYTPALWEEVDKFRAAFMTENLGKIFTQGKKEGYFVEHPVEIITTMFVSAVRGIVNPSFLQNNQLTFKEAIRSTIEILMYGILTDKGRKLYQKLKSEKHHEKI